MASSRMSFIMSHICHFWHMIPMFDGPRFQQEALDSVLGAAYSVSLWTTWSMQDDDMESPSCSRNRSHQKLVEIMSVPTLRQLSNFFHMFIIFTLFPKFLLPLWPDAVEVLRMVEGQGDPCGINTSKSPSAMCWVQGAATSLEPWIHLGLISPERVKLQIWRGWLKWHFPVIFPVFF